MLSHPAALLFPVHGTNQRLVEENFFEPSLPKPEGEEGCQMDLSEMLNLLMVILTLLGLIIEVIRLTLEVMDKASQKKNDDNKRLTAPVYQTSGQSF